jgi:hypothetical protein
LGVIGANENSNRIIFGGISNSPVLVFNGLAEFVGFLVKNYFLLG